VVPLTEARWLTNRVSQRREVVSLAGERQWPGVAALVVMPEPTVKERFEQALARPDTGSALYDLAKNLRSEGMSQLGPGVLVCKSSQRSL